MTSDIPQWPERKGFGISWMAVLVIVVGVGVGSFFYFKPPTKPDAPPVVKRPRPVPLAGWETPALAFVLSGEMHGYIEPCGCTEGQVGGLMRRATLIKTIQEEKKWPVIGLDNGGTMHSKRITRKQTHMKFDFTRDALEQMGFVSVNVGPEEAYLRDGGLMEVREGDKLKPDFHLRLQSANVSVYPGVPELEDVLPKYQIHETGGLKTAIISVMDPAIAPGLVPSEGVFEVTESAAAIAALLPAIDKLTPDVYVLLSHSSLEKTQELVKQFPQFHLAVAAGGPEDPALEATLTGNTMIVRTGQKGKNVGVVGLYPSAKPEGGFDLKYELVKLDGADFVDDKSTRDLMIAYINRLEVERPDLADNRNPPPPPLRKDSVLGKNEEIAAEYVGAETCGKCHTKAFAKWSTTGHARAFTSLSKGRPGTEATWIDRKWDADCLSCHVVGWDAQNGTRYAGGFIDEMETPHLAGQQCENCHGPGSRHVDIELRNKSREKVDIGELATERLLMKQTKAQAEQQLCSQCHDTDNSPHFNFKTYWEKVQHPGRD
ncbi:MAG: multiheme c-type cytochrome [Planctomycetaceae bacterium]